MSHPTGCVGRGLRHSPEALVDKVDCGRMGNTGPHDGCLFRGQGLLMTTSRDTVTRLVVSRVVWRGERIPDLFDYVHTVGMPAEAVTTVPRPKRRGCVKDFETRASRI